jgi:hypothetical protein
MIWLLTQTDQHDGKPSTGSQRWLAERYTLTLERFVIDNCSVDDLYDET